MARRLGISALVLVGALLLPAAVAARQSDIYSGFDRCPTSDPAMNDPESYFAACLSVSAGGGLLKVGSLEESIQTPLNVQAAIVGGDSGPALVPGSVSVEGLSFVVPLQSPGPQATAHPPAFKPTAATPAHHRKRHKRKKRRHRHHRHRHAGHRHRNLDQQVPSIEVSVEPAGEPTFELAGDPSDPFAFIQLLYSGQVPVTLRVPLKIHIAAPQLGLGPDCYIGSDSAPIVAAPRIVSAPIGFSFARDPNGYETFVVRINDFDIEDDSFAIPGAEGCGQNGSLNAVVDELAGLPAPAGSSRLLLSDVSVAVAVAGFLGSPGGGAELQAAFDAAR